jgi:hypothetical protein
VGGIQMTSIGTAPWRGILVRRAEASPRHPLPHVGSLPVTARCPSFLEPEFRVSQRRCHNAGAASTSSSSSASNCIGSCQFSSVNDALWKVGFGWGSHGVGAGRRQGFRVCRSTEDGGGEKGGGNSTSTATEEPEKDPNSADSASTPSTPPPVRVPFASHLCSVHNNQFFSLVS